MFGLRSVYCEHALVVEHLPRIAELNLGVEVLFETTEDLWPQVRWENLLDLVDAVADSGVDATVHGPFHNLNLGSRDAHIRQYSLELLTNSLDVARAFRSPIMVMHSGFNPQYPPKARTKWLDVFSQGLERLLSRASDVGVQLALENTYEPDTSLFEEIFERFSTPALGMCLDAGHATCFGRVEAAEWSRRFADRICHVHLSDNDGRDDLHQGLGQGALDLRAVLEPLVGVQSSAGVTFEVGADDIVASRDRFEEVVRVLSVRESS